MSKANDKTTGVLAPVTVAAEAGAVVKIDLGLRVVIPEGATPGAEEGRLLSDLHRDAQSGVLRVLRFGWAALRIKESLAHGEWIPWLKKHCPEITERSVQNYMKLTKHTLPEWETTEDFSAVAEDSDRWAGKSITALLEAAKPAASAPKPTGGAAQGKAKEASEDAGHDALSAQTDETVRGLMAQLSTHRGRAGHSEAGASGGVAQHADGSGGDGAR